MTSTLRPLTAKIIDSIRNDNFGEEQFDALAQELFAFQFASNEAFRKVCAGHGLGLGDIRTWKQIPAVPTVAFKELEVSVLPIGERTTVFHSSGTTQQRPSRHFHSRDSLAVYEASVLRGFAKEVRPIFQPDTKLLFLTPPPAQAPHSSLVHMLETLRCAHPSNHGSFAGQSAPDGTWHVRFDEVISSLHSARAVGLMGTAFNFVHLLDHLATNKQQPALAPGSFIVETGGYKGRSRVLSRKELHATLSSMFSVPCSRIFREYGMSELSSQAYDVTAIDSNAFQFPPWARFQIISPETGDVVADGEPGLLRICDLANVASAVMVQTEDLAVRRGKGFHLIGRAMTAEPRGCSLMAG